MSKGGYKLTYFDGRGRGEAARILLTLAGKNFVDERIDFKQWGDLKPKTECGVLPQIEDEDGKLGMSGAVIRHIARKEKLYGANEKEMMQVDMINDLALDLRDNLIKMGFEKPEGKAKDDLNTAIAAQMKLIEGKLKGDYFVGKKPTMADAQVYAAVEMFTMAGHGDMVAKDYPKLKAFCDRIAKLPNMVKYLKSRKDTPF